MAFSLKGNGGKIAVIGSVSIFSDTYIDKENNKGWLENIIEYLTNTNTSILEEEQDIEVTPSVNHLGIVPEIQLKQIVLFRRRLQNMQLFRISCNYRHSRVCASQSRKKYHLIG